jgi:mannose-6-phosphate isomerase-like protein (cupin superfamily)
MSFFDVRLAPGREVDPRPGRGMGEEVIVVLGGRVDVVAGRERRPLQAGDALHVRASGSVRFGNPGDEEARALWVTSPRYAL